MTCPALHLLTGTMGVDDTGQPITPRHVTVQRWDAGALVVACVHCGSTVTPGPWAVAQGDLRGPQ